MFFQNNTYFETISLDSIVSKLFRKLTSRVCWTWFHYSKSSIKDSISMKINAEIESLILKFHILRQRSQKRKPINKEEGNNKPRSIKNNEPTPLLFELLWLSFSALPPTIITTISNGLISMGGCGFWVWFDLHGWVWFACDILTIFVICGFVLEVGVVSTMGECFWVCSWERRMKENKERWKTKEQGTQA